MLTTTGTINSCWHLYVASGGLESELNIVLLLDQLPYQSVELGLPGFWDHSFPSPRPSDHMMIMGSITLNTRAERRKFLNKNTRTRVDTQMIGTKKNTFQLELKNRSIALEEQDDMDSLNKNMIEMIQQSPMSIAKRTKKQKKPKISSPTQEH